MSDSIDNPRNSRFTGEVDSLGIDSNNALFLHHSDHPNYVLSTQLLTDRNYYPWPRRRSVEVSLRAKNKLEFITGKCQRPPANSPLLDQWERCNSMVIAWLTHYVEKKIVQTLLYFDSAESLWLDLQIRFAFPNCNRIFQVQKELFTLSQGNLAISAYFKKFKRLWDEFVVLIEIEKCGSCGATGMFPQFLLKLQVIKFLVGLNDSYNMVRTNMLMIKLMPNIADVYRMCLDEEKQREMHSSMSVGIDSIAVNSFQKGPSTGYQNNKSTNN